MRDEHLLLTDIRAALDRIASCTRGMSQEEFAVDDTGDNVCHLRTESFIDAGEEQ